MCAQLTPETLESGVDADVRAHAVALGQRALTHGVADDLGQGIRPALLGRPLVRLAQRLGQGFDRRLQGRAAFAVEHPGEVEHAA